MPTISLIGLIMMFAFALVSFFVAQSSMSNITLSIVLIFMVVGAGLWLSGAFIPESLEKQYEQKVNAITEAEMELQKFLIDHPEFKENK